ncbi:FMN-dependent NADH-azoreductase [Limosilactobacillus caecicola]|uniref:FMN-dependent NADH-azoreductase n=1 Tax=Limosilactobacillus caecicola TaxID=2941332 RepID=UPI00203D5484|nr:FMN-dependent NADH-azoreductase [Limosilactobacillus caecicola]
MTKLLVIQAHPHTENSLSLTVGKTFIDTYRQAHPDDEIIIRDLYTQSVPPLNDVTINAWKKEKYGLPMNAEEQQLLAEHMKWLNEFIEADKYVFINPMYNGFLPAEMKQYIDLTVVPRKTFRYTSNGPVGLLTGKKALHIQAAGSVYHHGDAKLAANDLGDLYLTSVLKSFGVTDVQQIFIEGADAHRDQRQNILEAAIEKARQVAQTF